MSGAAYEVKFYPGTDAKKLKFGDAESAIADTA